MTDFSGKKALVVLTSTASFPGGEKATGYYADEMATPYYALRDAGVDVTIASITGGPAPMDPGSVAEEGKRKSAVQRLLDDTQAMAALEDTPSVTDLDPGAYDLVFLPGGHGTMWDFAQSPALADLVGRSFRKGAVIGAVCHGPAGLVSALDADGEPIVAGRRINSFTDEEERAVELADTVPYLLESTLRDKGALFEGGGKFEAYAVRDGSLVTGQNPASAGKVAVLLLEALGEQAPERAT